MIVDSSAMITVILREPGWPAIIRKLAEASTVGAGAPTLVETGLVLTAKIGPKAPALLSRFLREVDLVVIPFGETHWPVAVEAYARFGKGRHAAGLNFGDCLTYAVARRADQPLLFVGNDFAKTDIAAA